MNTTFTILGSGAGDVTALRSNASYVLSYQGKLFMFDCGSGATSAFLRSGFDPHSVQAIFISHMHSDHISDLPLFIQKLYLLKRVEPLPIYLPSEAIHPLNQYLNACYLFKEKLPFKLELIPMEPMITFFNKQLIINPFSNHHLMANSDIIENLGLNNRMQCFSFRINIDNMFILYSADIESLNDIEKYLDNLDLLVVETTHINLNTLKEYVERRGIGKIVLTHIADDLMENIRNLAASIPDKFIMAEDNLTIEL